MAWLLPSPKFLKYLKTLNIFQKCNSIFFRKISALFSFLRNDKANVWLSKKQRKDKSFDKTEAKSVCKDFFYVSTFSTLKMNPKQKFSKSLTHFILSDSLKISRVAQCAKSQKVSGLSWFSGSPWKVI